MRSEMIIQTQGLTKQYEDITAVSELNLSIRRGEVFGLLGPNGAGKTTTTLMLLGLTDPTSGTAEIEGFDCTRDSLKVKKLVGYLPDHVGFYTELSGMENLLFTAALNGMGRKAAEARAEALLERVGLTEAAGRRTGTYSRGMRQRLGIADVLMKDPEIIIMDEPTLGIDPQGMRELTALIRELSVKDGRTILISSHELYQIQSISDRVGIFVKGKLIACGKIQELGQQLENEGLYMIDLKAQEGAEALIQALQGIQGLRSIGRKPDGGVHVEARGNIRQEILNVVSSGHLTLQEMHERGGDLDEIYRKYFEKAGEQDVGSKDTEAHADNVGKILRSFGKELFR